MCWFKKHDDSGFMLKLADRDKLKAQKWFQKGISTCEIVSTTLHELSKAGIYCRAAIQKNHMNPIQSNIQRCITWFKVHKIMQKHKYQMNLSANFLHLDWFTFRGQPQDGSNSQCLSPAQHCRGSVMVSAAFLLAPACWKFDVQPGKTMSVCRTRGTQCCKQSLMLFLYFKTIGGQTNSRDG